MNCKHLAGLIGSILSFSLFTVLSFSPVKAYTPTPEILPLFGDGQESGQSSLPDEEELQNLLGEENAAALMERGLDLSTLASLLEGVDLSSLTGLLGDLDLSSFLEGGQEGSSSSGSGSSSSSGTDSEGILSTLLDSLGVTQRKIKDCKIDPIKDQIYSGKPLTPNPVVYYNTGRLKKGTDYTVKYTNNTSVGTAKVTITGKGSYSGQKTVSFKIVKKGATQASTVSDKKCKVTLSQTSYSYTGKERKPTVKVTVSGKAVPKTGYTVSYKGNIKVGIATVTIKGKGDYKGLSGEASFRIELKRTALKSASSKAEGTIVASWTADTQADGYEVQASTNKSFSSKTLLKTNVSGGKKSSCSFQDLVSGKKYYVRIRSYKEVEKDTWYCQWSTPKEVTVK